MNDSEEIKHLYDRFHEWVDEAFLEALQPHFRETTDPSLVKELIRVVTDGNSGSARGGKTFSEVVSFLLNDVLTRGGSAIRDDP